MRLTDKVIAMLESKYAKRWTKGNMDRLYISPYLLGLEIEYRRTGSICNATLNGEQLSNSEGGRLKYAKTYIDIETGDVVTDSPALQDAANKFLADAEEAAAEDETNAEANAEAKEEADEEAKPNVAPIVSFVNQLKADPRMGNLSDDVRSERFRMFDEAVSKATHSQATRFMLCTNDNERSFCLRAIMSELGILK